MTKATRSPLMRGLCLLMGAIAALGVALGAGAAPPEPVASDAPPVMEDLLVTGERTGPGMWHVHSATGDLWILGSLSPLPKGITWRSHDFEKVLDGARFVIVPKPFEVGIIRVLWLLITERSLIMIPGGRHLSEVMPPDLYRRFAAARSRYTDNSDKWERYRPIIAAAFLQQAAFHQVGLSTRLDLGAAVRTLADKHHVRIEELKIAGMHDVLDALKTMPPSTEFACVEASLATVERDLPRLVERARAWAAGNVELIGKLKEPNEVDACRLALESSGPNELIAAIRQTWFDALDGALRSGGTTAAVVNMDMLLEQGGLLDELRARGYSIDAP